MRHPETYRLQDSLPILDLRGPSDNLYMARKSVLIVEDEEDLNHALACRLRKEGFHVISTFDAKHGLAKTGFHKPDLVLIDLARPSLDDLEVLIGFLDVRKMRGVPVVMLTPLVDEELRGRADALGVATILEKPVPHGDVVAAIVELLPPDAD